MPLYGYLKPPQKSFEGSTIFGPKAKNVETWRWIERQELPEDVVNRCEFWCRTFLNYPAGMREKFYIDYDHDEVIIIDEYEWLSFKDEWGTEPLRFAPISPTLALAWIYGFPVKFSHDLYDPDYYTPYGPLIGVLNTNNIEIRFRILQYINEMETPKLPDPHDETAWRALERLREVAGERFPASGEFDIDHGGGIWVKDPRETNYCWAVVGDQWYAKAIPYLDEDLRELVVIKLKKYFRDFVLTLKPYDPHKGKLLLHGPGIGSWGEWGDAGKFSTNLLQTIWAYAQFTGDWDLIRERWDLIKRFFVLPEEMRWQGWGRYAIAELGDMAPNCIAMARMAWMVGDVDFYNFAAYCFTKELAVHYVMSLGAEYFYERRPHDRLEHMEQPIFLTNLWGETAGWQIDGPSYPMEVDERQYENRWVRFQDLDTARFYRDTETLHNAVKAELNDPKLLSQFRGREFVDDSHILPSLVRLHSLLLDEPPSELAKICDPKRISGPPPGIIASMIAFIRTSTPHEYIRLVPKGGGLSEIAPGLDREGGWRRGITETPCDPDLVMTLRGPWAIPTWRFWGGGGKPSDPDLSFGVITPNPEMCEGLCEDIPLSWISSVRVFEPVKTRVTKPVKWEGIWLLLGPLPNKMDGSLTEDAYPPEVLLSDSYVVEGYEYLWMFVGKPDVDLTALLGSDSGIAYLLTYVYSDRAQRAYMLISNTGGCRVWVNDEPTFSWHQRHGSFEFRVIINLKEGWNKLLVKLEGAWGRLKASCRLAYGDLSPLEEIIWDPSRGFKENGLPLLLSGNLTVKPTQILLGGVIRVTVNVANLGGSVAEEEVKIKIDGELFHVIPIKLNPSERASLEVEVGAYDLSEGVHEIEVNGLKAQFKILGWSSVAIYIGAVAALTVFLLIAFLLYTRGKRRK